MNIRKFYTIKFTPPSNNTCITFTLNEGGGFFSVFFFLCKAYIESKKRGVMFYITHDKYPYLVKDGWHDYFTTLTTTTKKPGLNCLSCSHIHTPNNWNHNVSEYISAIKEIFILKPELAMRVDNIVKSMGNYIGVFVRRGDKITETTFISVVKILECISYDENTVFFIQTDDYTVVEEFKQLLPRNNIVSTVSHLKRGSYHSKFYKNKLNITNLKSLDEKSPTEIKEETEEMLVGLMVCVNGLECWTDDTSNVGRFLKLYNPSKVNIYPKNYDLDLSKIVHPHHFIN